MHNRTFIAALFSSLCGLSACKTPGAQATPQSQAPASAGAAASEPGAPEIPWADKDHQQRMEYMGIYVLPKMSSVFESLKEDPSARFKCQNCHGDDMDAVNHEMPNDLYPLPAEGFYEAALEYDEQTTKFMAEQVVSAMSEVLGQDVNCLTCHPTE